MRRFVCSLLLAAALAACDSGEDAPPAGLLAQLAEQSRFETYAEVARELGLDATLETGGPYTVLAPTETAFEYVGRDLLPVLRQEAHRAVLARVLRDHVLEGALGPDDFTDGTTVRTLAGRTLTVRRLGPVVEVGGVTVDVRAAARSDQGVAYPAADLLLGTVTTAERVAMSPSLSQYRRLAEATGADGPLPARATVLAPLNTSVLALGPRLVQLQRSDNADVRRRVARAHVVSGTPDLTPGTELSTLSGDRVPVELVDGRLTIGGQPVIRVEDTADGRVVVLGGVVLSTLSLGQRMRLESTLQQFVLDLQRLEPGLWARLNDDTQQLTVFAPTDDAVSGRGSAVNAALRDPLNRPLERQAVRVHLVEGRYPPESLVSGMTLPALSGDSRRIEQVNGEWTYSERPVVRPSQASQRNGELYMLSAAALPLADGFDTLLLRGYVTHVRAIRTAALEAEFRQPGLTTFVIPEAIYAANPEILLEPSLRTRLRALATLDPVPPETNAVVTVRTGETRQVRYVPCAERGCTPYGLDGIPFDWGGASLDGQSQYHVLRSLYAAPTGS